MTEVHLVIKYTSSEGIEVLEPVFKEDFQARRHVVRLIKENGGVFVESRPNAWTSEDCSFRIKTVRVI